MVLEIADFGICENPDCQLSYRSPSLASLFIRINTISDMEKRKADVSGILPHLKPFALFFQFGTHCSRCGQFLYRVIQPTADLQTKSEEYIRRSKLNTLLAAGYQLQAWGVLPFAAP
jgi:hypothetical protein